MRLPLFFFIGALFLFPDKADATTLFFHGTPRQGEMLFGFVSPDSELTLNGEKLFPRKDGWFVVGIGRNDTEDLVFEAKKDGKTLKKILSVSKRKWNIQRVNGVPQNTVTPNKEEQNRIQRENKITEKARQKTVDMELPLCFIKPAKGKITGIYGSQRILNGTPANMHNALDIANKKGTIIRAPADGIVLLSYDTMLVSGKTLILGHGQNLTTSYIHMDNLFVKTGQKVKKGEQLGTIGSTGRATGPHLHWTVMWKDKRVDPQVFLKNSSAFCASTKKEVKK